MKTNAAYQSGDGKDGNYTPDRNDLINQLEKLRQYLVRVKDGNLSACVSRAYVPLLSYPGSLLELDVDTLSKIGNMGKNAAKLVHRVFQGETVEAICGDLKGEGAGLAGNIGWVSKDKKTN